MRIRKPQISLHRKHQLGVALFISLVLLLVLTIIGVSSVQTTSLEMRMTRNDHDRVLAFQAAESALRDGENQLEGIAAVTLFTATGNNGLYTVADMDDPEHWETEATWTTAANHITAGTTMAGVATPPRYIIEHLASVLQENNAYQQGDPYAAGAVDRIEIFRITAVGNGGSNQAQVTLQSTYGRVMD